MNRLAAIFVLLLVLFATDRASADSSNPARSVEKADTGLALFEKGSWEAALASFREAEVLYHSPVYVLYTAKCLEQLGRFTEAKREYERVASEELPSSAPDPWRSAKEEGRSALFELDARFPSIRIQVPSSTPTTRVSVDGNAAALGEELPLDPGTHRIEAVDGARRAQKSVTLTAGQKAVNVELRLPRAIAARPTKPKPSPKRGPNVPGLVLTIVGGAALIGGGVTGIVALKKADEARNDLPESCVGTKCPESQRGAVEDRTASARRFATISDGLFIGGSVLVTAGVLLLLIDPGAKPQAAFRSSHGVVRF